MGGISVSQTHLAIFMFQVTSQPYIVYHNTTGVDRGGGISVSQTHLVIFVFQVTSQPYIVYHNTTGVDSGGGHQCFTNTSCYLCVSGDIKAIHRVP